MICAIVLEIGRIRRSRSERGGAGAFIRRGVDCQVAARALERYIPNSGACDSPASGLGA